MLAFGPLAWFVLLCMVVLVVQCVSWAEERDGKLRRQILHDAYSAGVHRTAGKLHSSRTHLLSGLGMSPSLPTSRN